MKKLFEAPEVDVLRLYVQDQILGLEGYATGSSPDLGDYEGEEDVLG